MARHVFSALAVPRIVLPQQTLFITRRTVARFFLFRPDRALNEAFCYCLAIAAEEHGVVVHAAILMSTHYHLIVTDTRGEHPLFTQMLNRLFANYVKVHRGWTAKVFGKGRPNVVRLKTLGAVIDKVGYALGNAVDAGAVRFGREWPGVRSTVAAMGGAPRTVTRPDRYFADDRGVLPVNAQLRYVLHEALVAEHAEQGARELLTASVEEHEARARQKVKTEGRRFLGRDRVLKTSPYRRATAHEELGGREPTFATKGGGKEAFFEAVEERSGCLVGRILGP